MQPIPTRGSGKLPQGFSDPIAARLSAAPSGVPPFDRLRVFSSRRAEFRASGQAAITKSSGGVDVLVAGNSSRRPEWNLRVHAVPGAHAAAARASAAAVSGGLRARLVEAGAAADGFGRAVADDPAGGRARSR